MQGLKSWTDVEEPKEIIPLKAKARSFIAEKCSDGSTRVFIWMDDNIVRMSSHRFYNQQEAAALVYKGVFSKGRYVATCPFKDLPNKYKKSLKLSRTTNSKISLIEKEKL